MSVSIYGSDLLAEIITGKTSVPGTLYLALLTDLPEAYQDGSEIAEVTGGAYVRRAIQMNDTRWSDASSGFVSTLVEIAYPIATTDWGEVNAWALCTTLNAGTGEVVVFGTFNSAQTIWADTQIILDPGSIGIRITSDEREVS